MTDQIRLRLRELRRQVEAAEEATAATRQRLASYCRTAQDAGLSLAEIGRELGVSKQRVSKMISEVGRVSTPR